MEYLCRVCGTSDLYEVLDMGMLPLAGDFRAVGERNQLYPLAIDGCASCGVLQVRDLVDPRLIFSEKYSYASSTVPALVRHFEEFAREIALPSEERGSKLLLEIGCNDGVFLERLIRVGYRVVGIDAAENVARIGGSKGLDIHVGFFSLSSAKQLLERYGHFDIVTCSNVFAHIPAVNNFLEAVALVLHPRHGEFWIEVHSAEELHEKLQWDFFYHEHCYYWTPDALVKCLGRHGFKLKHHKRTSMHGGAIRAIFSKSSEEIDRVERRLTRADWIEFRDRCLRSRRLIRDCVDALPITYGYGASGRAVTLINWTGIAAKLRFVVDGSPLRYNKMVPNTEISIISEEEFFRGDREVGGWCLVTAHNYFEDIRAKVLQRFGDRDIRFVLPLPYVTIR